MPELLRARYQIGIRGAGVGPGFPDLIGSIELAHTGLTEQLKGTGLVPTGRPVIEKAAQNNMVLSWALKAETDV